MNENPEQIARDYIDKQLLACGWLIQDRKKLNLAAGLGIAVCEYQTDVWPADYVLFIDYRDPKPRARQVFTFHRPETFAHWIKDDKTLRARLQDIPALPIEGLSD